MRRAKNLGANPLSLVHGGALATARPAAMFHVEHI